jgi:hypothetical protein
VSASTAPGAALSVVVSADSAPVVAGFDEALPGSPEVVGMTESWVDETPPEDAADVTDASAAPAAPLHATATGSTARTAISAARRLLRCSFTSLIFLG